MRLLAKAAFSALTVLVIALIAGSYLGRPLGSAVTPDMAMVFRVHWLGISTHIIAASIAMVLAPVQLSSRLRRRWPALHRWFGRTYLGVGVGLGGVAGLYMGTLSARGWVARGGFICLALAWLATGVAAYRCIRQGNVSGHRGWMMRNISLTSGAIMLRLYVPTSALLGIPFEVAYPAIAWLAWVPNLVLVELWLRHAASHDTTHRATAARSTRSTAGS